MVRPLTALLRALKPKTSSKYSAEDPDTCKEGSEDSLDYELRQGSSAGASPSRVPSKDSSGVSLSGLCDSSTDELNGSKKMLRHFQSIKVSRTGKGSPKAERQHIPMTEKEKTMILRAIADNILFQNCSLEVRREVTNVMYKMEFKAGSVIIQQGDLHGEDFFVMVDGCSEVTKTQNGREILRFKYEKVPQAFGELALLYQSPRAASVAAHTDVTCWVLNYRDFNQVRRTEQLNLNREKRRAVEMCDVFAGLDSKQKLRAVDALEKAKFEPGAVVLREGEAPGSLYIVWTGAASAHLPDGQRDLQAGSSFGKISPLCDGSLPRVVAKTELVCFVLDGAGCDAVSASLRELRIFRSLSKVPMLLSIGKEHLMEITPKFQPVFFNRGEYVIREGETGDAFFVVESGLFRVLHSGRALPASEMGPGHCFGEASLLGGASSVRTADVVAAESGYVMRLSKADFVRHLGHLDDMKNLWRIVVLRKTKLLRKLNHDKMLEVAKVLSREILHQGQVVIKKGDIGDKFYIIESGTCEVLGSNNEVLNRIEDGTPFGEAALLTASKRTATVKVTSPQCYILSLNRGDFYSLLGGVMDDLKAAASSYLAETGSIETFQPRDIKWVRPFGVGAYAVVYLGWWRDRLYAIKTINKQHMVTINQANEVVSEKRMLQDLDSNFCVRLVATAQDSRNLYMMMNPVLGGELFTLVAETLGPLPEDKSRFYAACTVLGLEYLHENNIIYRDLKLENLLIDRKGYLKIADLGIAKKLYPGEKTYTFKGTPDYMAPEYLTSSGVTHSADWWALGVLIFEINAGYTPFQADDPMEMFRKISHVHYSCPNTFSTELIDLIGGLLEKKVARRLGSGVTGSLEVKNHPWFQGLDWGALKEMKLPAPWLPDINLSRLPPPADIKTHPVSLGERVSPEHQHLFEGF